MRLAASYLWFFLGRVYRHFVTPLPVLLMASDDESKKARTVEARARSISQNVRCTDCGSQSIEDSQADVAILLRKVTSFFLHLICND